MRKTLSQIVVYMDRLLKSGSIVWICCLAVVYADTIQNSATLHYKFNTTDFQVQSNTVSDPVIDSNGTNGVFVLRCVLSDALQVTPGMQRAALPFSLANTQSTAATLTLQADVNATDTVENAGVFSDANGNGVFDNSDTAVTSVTVAAGATQRLFFVSDIPSGASWSFSSNGIRATDRSTTPSLTAYAQCRYTLSAGSTLPPDKRLKVVKSASLSSDRLYRGSVITYHIRIEALDTVTIQDPVFADAIPAGTTFVPGSVTLDGGSKPDKQVYDGSTVTVSLPDMSQGDVHTVIFSVKVNQ